GVAALLLSHLTAWVTTLMYFLCNNEISGIYLLVKFAKIQGVIFFHFLGLVGYIIAYRYLPGAAQPFLTLGLIISVFILRKVLLAFTSIFPLPIAMLISSLWIENMSDMFQVLVYPSIHDYQVYFGLWILSFFGNVVNLLF